MPTKIIAANKLKKPAQPIDATPSPHISAIIGKLMVKGCDEKLIAEVLDLIEYEFAERVSKKT